MSDTSRDDLSPPTTPPTDKAVPPSLVPLYEMLRPPEQPGELGRLKGHRILEKLGAGGMGQVFRAEELALGRQVALKVIHPERQWDAHSRQRFLLEARALATIGHQHVVPLYLFDEDRDTPFFTMQLLRGASLWQVLRHSGGFLADLAGVVRIGRQIAEGLEAIHAGGFIHRDLKPSNVWLRTLRAEDGVDVARTSGWVVLLDFGLARTLEAAPGATPLTQPGAVIGTFGYMAPEQAAGAHVDLRADLFSLGVILDEMIHGPRDRSTGGSPVASLQAGGPPALRELVDRLLAHRTELRPQSAGEVAQALHAVEADLGRAPRLEAGEVDVCLTVRRRRNGVPAEPLASTAGVVPAATRGMKVIQRLVGRPIIHTGEEICVEVSANQPGYLTVFNIGPTDDLVQLHPDAPLDEKAPPPPVPANKVQHVVDVELQPPAGLEKLYAVWTRTPRSLGESELRLLAQRGDLPAHGRTRNLKRIPRVGGVETQGDWHIVALELDHQA